MTTPHEVCFGAVVSNAKGVQAIYDRGLIDGKTVTGRYVSFMSTLLCVAWATLRVNTPDSNSV
jgi:hypothetical protein